MYKALFVGDDWQVLQMNWD